MNNTKSPLAHIMKIMNLMMQEAESPPQLDSDQHPMMDRLVREGYQPEDIETAIKWLSMIASDLEDLPADDSLPMTQSADSIRHLHEMEAMRLSGEAQKLLLNLLETGAVSSFQVDRTMEYIWRNDLRHVSAERLELLLLMNEAGPSADDALASDQAPRPFRFH